MDKQEHACVNVRRGKGCKRGDKTYKTMHRLETTVLPKHYK